MREYVKDVLDIVELTPLRHALVGVPGTSGLTVEQRKRLTIAVELVSNPSVIFMDEPTSGERATGKLRFRVLWFWVSNLTGFMEHRFFTTMLDA